MKISEVSYLGQNVSTYQKNDNKSEILMSQESRDEVLLARTTHNKKSLTALPIQQRPDLNKKRESKQ